MMTYYMAGAAALVVALSATTVYFLRRRKSNARKDTSPLTASIPSAAPMTVSDFKAAQRKHFLKKGDELEGKAIALFRDCQYEAAEQLFEQVLAIALLTGNKLRETSARHNLAIVLWRTEERSLAFKILSKLVPEAERILPPTDKRLEVYRKNLKKLNAELLRDQAMAAYEEGYRAVERQDWAQGQKSYVEAAKLAEQAGDRALQADILNSHARICSAQRRFPAGLEFLRRAQILAQKHCTKGEELPENIAANIELMKDEQKSQPCRDLIGQAEELIDQGEHARAEAVAMDALSSAQQAIGGQHWLTAIAMDRLGLCLYNQGRYREALNRFNAASHIALEWPDAAADVSRTVDKHIRRCRTRLGY